MMTNGWMVLTGTGIFLFICIWQRLALEAKSRKIKPVKSGWFIGQTMGNKEIQADCVQLFESEAGFTAVMADGIGKENTGKVAAQVAVDTVLDAFTPYKVLQNPEYLFQTAFMEAHRRIQQTIGERRGGVSMGAVFVNNTHLYYALAGNIRIALLRNDELIPLSNGQTIDALVRDAYQDGMISKNETIWSQSEKQIWNYLGKDGFHEIETSRPPVALQAGDMVVMLSQGIYEELSWAETEEILLMRLSLEVKVNIIIAETEKKETQDKDNGSVLLLAAEVW